jgi:predicted metal-dependent phosphoesterase TrpH
MSLRIDLHVHSTASDGTDSPTDLVGQAAAAGLDVVALTDHDTDAGLAEAAAALPAGMTLVPGTEISCALHIHLLAYLYDPAEPGLAAELRRLRHARYNRGRRMVARLQELGVPVQWDAVLALAGGAPVGRPHVANALVNAGVASYAEAFTDSWLGHGGPAYVGKVALDPAYVVGLVRAAGGVAVCAHPGGRKGVADATLAAMAAAGLTGIEVSHPEHDAPTRRRLRGLASELGLLVTGGSDYHGSRKASRLGGEVTEPDQCAALLAAATGARPVCR